MADDEEVPDAPVKSGTDTPWKDPNQNAQDPTKNPPAKPDLERWQTSKTH